MATVIQQNLAQNIIENTKRKKPLNKKELLVSAGYDVTTAEASADRTIQQKGVQEELKKYGFDEDSAKEVVKELMGNKVDPAVRLRAASEVFKVFGTYAAEKSFNLTATASVDEIKKVIQDDLAKFRPNQ